MKTKNGAEWQTALFLSPMQGQLLQNAEKIIQDSCCLNHCRHHKPFQVCEECPRLSVPSDGYIVCDGYEQCGEAVVA